MADTLFFRLTFLICAFYLCLIGWSSTAQASAWTDYLGQARAVVETENRRLNAVQQPAREGEVKLSVEVRQTGSIAKAKVIGSSGDDAMDAAALASIEALGELPTPPVSVYFKQFFTPLTFTWVFAPVVAVAPRPVLPVAVEVEPEEPEDVPSEQDLRAREIVAGLQSELKLAGYDPGPVDGLYGNGTAAAIRAFQIDRGLIDDGVPTAELLQQVRTFNQVPGIANNDVPANPALADVAPDNAAPEGAAGNAGTAVSLVDPEVARPALPAESGLPDAEESASTFTPPEKGSFSLNREIVEDYEYRGDQVLEDYESF